MGRPDLTAQRTAEILDAFEGCIVRFGLPESSLERIAEEAGMKRSILRHYVGNRDDLIIALTQRVVQKYLAQFDDLMNGIGSKLDTNTFVDLFLPQKPRETGDSVIVIESLIAAAESDSAIQDHLTSYVESITSRTAARLKEMFPSSSKPLCWSVAYGVVSIWFNQESLASLELTPKYLRASRASMKTLVDSLR